MHDQFRNEKCAVCGMKLFEDEEIVVCPECGTPYHKECWYRAGLCVHSAEHGAFEWKGESQKLKEHFENIETAQNEKKENDPQFEIIHAESYDEYREIMNKRLLEQEKDMGEVDGVTPEEMLKFVGKNGYYYLPVFREFIKHGKIMKMNFAAFLLFPLHCFYRKMNLFGVIGTAIFFLFFDWDFSFWGTAQKRNDLWPMQFKSLCKRRNRNTAGSGKSLYRDFSLVVFYFYIPFL